MSSRKPIVHRFDSVADCIDAVRERADENAVSHTSRANWMGTESFEEACQMALEGWGGVRADLSKLVNEVSSTVLETETTVWEPVFDVEGGVVDVDAFNMGVPDCMMSFENSTRTEPRQVITVLVNTCVSGGFSAEQMLTRAAGICGLVEVLMGLGYGTEIWAECADGPCGGQWWNCLVKVKGTDDYVDMDQVAFAIGHPSWLRRIMFGMMEGESAEVRARFGFLRGGAYGRVGACQMKEEVGADVVVEGALYGRDRSTDAVGWVRDALRKLGIGQSADEGDET